MSGKVILFISLVMGQLTVGQFANGQDLRWKFKSGDQFSVQMHQSLIQATEVNGKKLSTDLDFVLGMNWKVKEINKAGNAVMDQDFSSLTIVWQSTGESKMRFDSANKKKLLGLEKRISESLTPIMQSKFTVEMSPRGEIIAVEADQETMEILRKAPDSMEIRKLFTAEGISKTLSSSAMIFPETQQPTWEQKEQIEAGMNKATYLRTFTIGDDLKKDGRLLKKIDIKGEVQFAQKPDKVARQPQKLTENSQSGVAYFDAEAGHLTQCDLKQEIKSETPYRHTVLRANTSSTLTTTIQRINSNDAE